jgi:hypothetical protein
MELPLKQNVSVVEPVCFEKDPTVHLDMAPDLDPDPTV